MSFPNPGMRNFLKELRKQPGVGPFGPSAVLGIVLLVGGAYAASESLYTVEGGHRAIKYSRFHGVLPQIYGEGTHFLIPWIERPIIYDVRAKPRSIPSLTGTKDLQMVNITCRVLSRPRVEALGAVYRELGMNYDEVVLPSVVNEVLKAVVAQFNASQLITQRELVSRLIRENLVRRASRFNLVLDDVSLTHITFSPAFSEAVEAKQIAQQTAQRAAYVVDKAIQEKQSTIVRAQGEARSAELIGESVRSNPGFLQLRALDAAREIASTIAPSGNNIMVDSKNLLLDLPDIVMRPEDNKKEAPTRL